MFYLELYIWMKFSRRMEERAKRARLKVKHWPETQVNNVGFEEAVPCCRRRSPDARCSRSGVIEPGQTAEKVAVLKGH